MDLIKIKYDKENIINKNNLKMFFEFIGITVHESMFDKTENSNKKYKYSLIIELKDNMKIHVNNEIKNFIINPNEDDKTLKIIINEIENAKLCSDSDLEQIKVIEKVYTKYNIKESLIMSKYFVDNNDIFNKVAKLYEQAIEELIEINKTKFNDEKGIISYCVIKLAYETNAMVKRGCRVIAFNVYQLLDNLKEINYPNKVKLMRDIYQLRSEITKSFQINDELCIDDAEKFYKIGNFFETHIKDYDEAIKNYEKSIEMVSTYYCSYYRIGKIYNSMIAGASRSKKYSEDFCIKMAKDYFEKTMSNINISGLNNFSYADIYYYYLAQCYKMKFEFDSTLKQQKGFEMIYQNIIEICNKTKYYDNINLQDTSSTHKQLETEMKKVKVNIIDCWNKK